jgi:hypothetical protein
MVTHPELSELAGRFFVRFARFDSALKQSGFGKQERNNGVAADWNAFAHRPEIGSLFHIFEVNPITAYIINSPPKKRVMIDGVLGWREVKKPVNAVELTEALGRVRNNLFHGDKRNPNLSRNAELLNASLDIMDAMLDSHDGVRLEYESMQDIA